MANSQNKQDLNLEHLIIAYADARAEWLDTSAPNTDLVSDGERFEAFETAGRAILHYPCLTLDAIRRKVSFVVDAPDLCTMVREDEDEGDNLLRVFLSSLIPDVPVSKPRH